MSFADFIIDEEDGKNKRKQIEDVIKKAVKPCLIDTTETEDCCVINFQIGEGTTIKDVAAYQVIVTLDYYKKVYRGMHRAVYVNIIKQTNSYKSTDYIQVDVHRMSEGEFAKTLDSIKQYFQKLCLTN